ncbi:phosphotransferase [Bacteroides fluxus]|uniref:Choline/ethanolamine kinase n=1 Tax=Bacteroides fluxus YIT 12057 TaxID=763034 RepID=F3PXT1_9BACE|nr:phosphotransferase [Bacteroides fluxus]EGF51663.1 Choline/ethanolamine kinase [Bacteroides fluxus YIT 12057]
MMKTAVILAARKEHDSSIPYPLLPIMDGQCLLERTLGILEDLGYDKIILVVGYKASLFDRFKSDKVSIVVNRDYRFTSSMGSLALAATCIDEDFLLIEGDVFYERVVLERLSQTRYDNCLVLTEESGNGDEAFAETKNGFVVKISKDKHRIVRFNGEMLGLLKISKDTLCRMMLLWEQSTNSLMNYEYILFDVTESVDRPYIFFKNLIWGEVDNRADYEKLINDVVPQLRRKENPFDKENLLEYLQQIFPDRCVTDAQIMQIGGMSNRNFRVTLGSDDYVLRVPGIGADGMVERRNEEINSLLGCKIGVNPEIIYFNSETGVKLAAFIKNAETLNSATVQRSENMRNVVRILRTLHNSNVRLNNEFNIFHEIEKYERLMKDAGGVMYAGWEDVRERVMSLEGYLNDVLGVELCPCHNDLVAENFIKDENGKMYLIDWEYSGINDPMADLGALFLESRFTEDNMDYVLQGYFDGNVPETAKTKIIIYQILFDYLWAVWTVIKEAKGDDLGTYGQERFSRAKKQLADLSIFLTIK